MDDIIYDGKCNECTNEILFYTQIVISYILLIITKVKIQ